MLITNLLVLFHNLEVQSPLVANFLLLTLCSPRLLCHKTLPGPVFLFFKSEYCFISKWEIIITNIHLDCPISALLKLLRTDRRTDMVKLTDNYCSFLLRECHKIKIDMQKPNSYSGNQEIAAFHGTQSFVTVITKVCHLSLSCAR